MVKFSEDKNGLLTVNIEKILVTSEANKCTMCEGTYKNKSLIGLTIVKNLKNVGQNKYDKGSILDPQSDTTYRFSVTVSPDGEKLTAQLYWYFCNWSKPNMVPS